MVVGQEDGTDVEEQTVMVGENNGQQPAVVVLVQEQEVMLEKPAVEHAPSLPPPAPAPPLPPHEQEQPQQPQQQVESPAPPPSPRPGQQKPDVSHDIAWGLGSRPPDPRDGHIQRGRIQYTTAHEQQQEARPRHQQLQLMASSRPLPSWQSLSVGLGALITTSVSFGTRWFGFGGEWRRAR